MKRCSYCGAEYPDEINECPLDHATVVPPESAANAKNEDAQKQPMPKWRRTTLRAVGTLLLLFAIYMYLKGLDAVRSGDYEVAGLAYYAGSEYTTHVTNIWYRTAFLLFPAGVACIAYTIPFKIRKDKRKHDHPSA